MPNFAFSNLESLLGCSAKSPDVREFFGPAISSLTRDEYYGSIDFRNDGVEAVFKEAPWVVPEKAIDDPKDLYLSAFHFHRAGHEGYSGYAGQLQNGVILGDPELEIFRKMGQPDTSGGGSMSSVLKRAIPRWLQYQVGNTILHLQMDPNGQLEMATLYSPEMKVIQK